jgi:hypothetical protein
MNAIRLGDPNLFVKGMVEVVVTDPTTGNIIGYDNVATESAVNTSVNMGEITVGLGNPLLINIPDTTRITGSLTSQAFSLQQRALTTGGTLANNGVVSYCETLTTDSNGVITVSRTPVMAYGQPATDTMCWCYVRPHGTDGYQGTNIGVSPTTLKTPVGAALAANTQYDVFYFVSMASAKVLALPSNFNPSVATIRLKYCVYAKQNNSVSNGTLQGYLYFIVPRAQFQGDAGLGASQTSNATTAYDWMAITPDRNMIECNNCGESGADYAYYVYAPCSGDTSANIDSLHLIGGPTITIQQGGRTVVSPFLLMKDGSLATPDYRQFEWEFNTEGPGAVGSYTANGVTADGVVLTSDQTSETAVRIYYNLWYGPRANPSVPEVKLKGTIDVVSAS